MVAANGKTSTIAAIGTGAVSIAPGISAIQTALPAASALSSGFVVASQTIIPGGSAVVISGTTYSALPTNSGILVAANGHTSTIAVTGTGAFSDT